MNCEQACLLIDDYLESRLSGYERHCLEEHLASCRGCVEEVRGRAAFDHAIWQALAASVQHQSLSPEASTRIVRAAQASTRQAIWSSHALLAVRMVATLATVVLVVAGILVLVDRVPSPVGPRKVTLLPVLQLALSELSPVTLAPTNQPTLPEQPVLDVEPADEPVLMLSTSDMRVEPKVLNPSQWFTITLALHSKLPQPVDGARIDLEVSGPPGIYRFPLSVEGPLPAPGVSILRVTPDQLAAICQKQYLISPTDMFEAPGLYTVRVTLHSPVYTPAQ
jgi:anti-sigma factor RsiW